MLRCIRCGACLNHCPVYGAIGGHAYGWVYPGPMGAVLTPHADRHRRGAASAERFDLLRALRGVCPVRDSAAQDDAALAGARIRQAADPPRCERLVLTLWAFAAKRPRLYHALAGAWRVARCAARSARTLRDCRCRRPGPRCAICRRRKATPFTALWARRCERMPMSAAEDPRHCLGTHSRLARRGELGPRTQGLGRARLERHRRTARFLRAPAGRAECLALFIEMLTAQGADVRACAHAKKAVAAIGLLSRPCNLPAALRMGRDAKLAALPWRDAWDIERASDRRSRATGAACRTRSLAAAPKPARCSWFGRGKPDHAEFPPRDAHRSDRSGRYRRLATRRLGPAAGDPRQGHAAPHRQPDQRAVADGRYRADHRQRRAWAAPAAWC